MTTATATLPVQSTTRSLEQQLSILNAEQQEALFAYYGSEGLDRHDSLQETNATPEQVQSALAEFINNDSNEAQKTRLLGQLEEYNATYRLREESFTEAEDTAKYALTAKREANKELTKSVKDFTKALVTNLTGTNEELLQQRRIDQNNNQAWEKREKIRQRGIDAYLRGIVAAVIDDCEDKYKQEAREKAATTSKTAKAQVKALNDKGLEPTSLENTQRILKNSFPKKNKNDSPASLIAARSATLEAARQGAPTLDEKEKPQLKGFGK